MTTIALLLAGGTGTRFGGTLPKQYATLLGRPVLARAASCFLDHPRVDAVRIVAQGPEAEAIAGSLGLPPPIAGGSTRQESARAGLEALARDPPVRVLIHDAARPIVPPGLIDRVIDALEDGAKAVIPALAVTDTLKRAEGGWVTGTVPREGLNRVQTPQGFDFAAILAAHRSGQGLGATDDAAVAEAAGLPVRLVPGAEEVVKVTLPEDLDRAAMLLGRFLMPRIGQGVDAHRFAEGRRLILCGIEIEGAVGLDGHSDADVGLHALTDAIYGALGEGDIGRHFPPSEAAWKDADSARFLLHAASRVRARSGLIAHADVTLVCERPRIAPHADRMRERIAGLLGVAPGQVGVKGTTTEQMGFAGRGEGIAAFAVATLMLPP